MATGGTNAEAQSKGSSIDVVPTIDSIKLVDGQLVASGTATAQVKGRVHTVPFTNVPINLALADDQTGAGECPILDLELGPITLDLLGLVVETSPICLRITAFDEGGLLGDLLCTVANLLDDGIALDEILDGLLGDGVVGVAATGLTETEINDLLGGLTELLNSALDNLLGAVLTDITHVKGPRQCAILHLEVGPLELNLLGLEVELDDCDGGPVTVDITAVRGALLGNLLCQLVGKGGILTGDTLLDIINELLDLPAVGGQQLNQ